MEKKSCDTCIRWICGILFTVFAFCWLHYFQHDLLCVASNRLLYGIESPVEQQAHNQLLISLLLTAVALLLVVPGRIILRFKKGMYACNYLLSAAFLGIITGYDGSSLLGQSYTVWMVTAIFAVVLFLICKIVASVPKSEYNDRPRTLAGNLLLLSLLFSMVGYLGNTDENLHRRLRMENLLSEGDYVTLLEIGMNEEESDPAIDLLRAKAMLNLQSGDNPAGSAIGARLFSYPISNPSALSQSLKALDNNQAYLASCLLEGNTQSFLDSIKIDSYQKLPTYYMQALVIANDSIAGTKFPRQYAEEKALYNSFCETLAPLELEPQQYQANATFIKFHTTYFWYYTFRR